jgi:hypothetical protein
MIFETVETINGKRKIRRVKTSFIMSCGISFIPLGLYLVIAHEMLFGATLVILFSPCFILYPIIRFFCFGGKDSVAAVVTTVVVEEVTKSALKDAFSENKKRRRR